MHSRILVTRDSNCPKENYDINALDLANEFAGNFDYIGDKIIDSEKVKEEYEEFTRLASPYATISYTKDGKLMFTPRCEELEKIASQPYKEINQWVRHYIYEFPIFDTDGSSALSFVEFLVDNVSYFSRKDVTPSYIIDAIYDCHF